MLKGYILDPDCEEQVKLMLASFIEKVEIGNYEVKVTFNVAFSFYNEKGDLLIYPYSVSSTIFREELFKRYQSMEQQLKDEPAICRFLRFLFPNGVRKTPYPSRTSVHNAVISTLQRAVNTNGGVVAAG